MSQIPLGKILIAEDEPMILAVAQADFEDAGYQVIPAADGKNALLAFQSHPDIDLLFTDIRMPGLDGWTLAKTAKDMSPSLCVIYATGFSDEAPRPVEGALLFMKPYRLSGIVEAAASLIAAR